VLPEFGEWLYNEIWQQWRNLTPVRRNVTGQSFVYTYGESRDATLSTAETGGTTVETGTTESIQSQLVWIKSGNIHPYTNTCISEIHDLKFCLPHWSQYPVDKNILLQS